MSDGAVASDEGRADSLIDLYWLAAIPAFLLLLIDVALVARALGEVRPTRALRDERGPGRGRDRAAAVDAARPEGGARP